MANSGDMLAQAAGGATQGFAQGWDNQQRMHMQQRAQDEQKRQFDASQASQQSQFADTLALTGAKTQMDYGVEQQRLAQQRVTDAEAAVNNQEARSLARTRENKNDLKESERIGLTNKGAIDLENVRNTGAANLQGFELTNRNQNAASDRALRVGLAEYDMLGRQADSAAERTARMQALVSENARFTMGMDAKRATELLTTRLQGAQETAALEAKMQAQGSSPAQIAATIGKMTQGMAQAHALYQQDGGDPSQDPAFIHAAEMYQQGLAEGNHLKTLAGSNMANMVALFHGNKDWVPPPIGPDGGDAYVDPNAPAPAAPQRSLGQAPAFAPESRPTAPESRPEGPMRTLRQEREQAAKEQADKATADADRQRVGLPSNVSEKAHAAGLEAAALQEGASFADAVKYPAYREKVGGDYVQTASGYVALPDNNALPKDRQQIGVAFDRWAKQNAATIDSVISNEPVGRDLSQNGDSADSRKDAEKKLERIKKRVVQSVTVQPKDDPNRYGDPKKYSFTNLDEALSPRYLDYENAIKKAVEGLLPKPGPNHANK